MKKDKLTQLKTLAYSVRKNIIDMAEHGGCYIGSAYSCVELIVYLYENFMKYDFAEPANKDRDLLFLSKGHAVSALYSYFVEKKILSRERLKNHQCVKDDIYLHPNPSIAGIEFHSGSLGHLLSIGVGAALNFKSKKLDNRVIVILGDGELNEGSNWEALMIASAQNLDNLLLLIDRNKFQANFRTEDLIPIEPLFDKLKAFGCSVFSVHGHSFQSIEECFSQFSLCSKKPIAVIANTTRGKGIKSYEDDWEKWFVEITTNEKTELLNQLQIINE